MELNRIEKTRLKLLERGTKIINLSSGNPGEFGITFPREILERGFRQFQKHSAYTPDPKGDAAARQSVADFYIERGLRVGPEKILLTSGTSESYLHIFKLLAGPDGEILFPNPGYPLFDHIAGMANVRLNYYELDEGNDWQIDPLKLEKKISAKTRAIVLISPNNPTGGVLSEETMGAVLSVAKKHSLPIIGDEVFSEFIFDGKRGSIAGSLAAQAEGVNIFTLSGISKTYALPGLKLSWILATGPSSGQYIDELELSVDTLLAGNQMSQAMLPEIIRGGKQFMQDYRQRVELSKNAAVSILAASPNLAFNKPKGGFYIFAEVKNYHGSDEDFVVELLEKTGIFVHPGYFYDYEKGLHVLISFLMEASELSLVLERFTGAVNGICGKN